MMNNMISVIVPVYNAASCIADTILCVKNQTYEDWELILVDDASTDRSVEVITPFLDEQIKLLHTQNGGSAAVARNMGIEAANGRYIAFLDADDLWKEDKLSRQLAFLREHEAAFTFTGYEFADECGVGLGKIVHVPDTITYRQALSNTTIFTSTVMFDVSVLGKGLIMMPRVPSEDTATWWKVLKTGVIGYGLDEVFTMYRRSGKTLSSNKIVAIKRIWNLYRNVEGISVLRSAVYFVMWAFRAVLRRV